LIDFTTDELITFTVAARQLMHYKYSGPFQQHMMLQRTHSEEKRLKKGPGVTALCYTPNMRLKTVLITLNWYVT